MHKQLTNLLELRHYIARYKKLSWNHPVSWTTAWFVLRYSLSKNYQINVNLAYSQNDTQWNKQLN